jgi:hypothetical protein
VIKHSRRTRHARSLHRSRGRPFGESQPIEPEPERLLLDQIASGALDAYLTAIAEAIGRFRSGEIRRCSPLLWEETMSMLKELP